MLLLTYRSMLTTENQRQPCFSKRPVNLDFLVDIIIGHQSLNDSALLHKSFYLFVICCMLSSCVIYVVNLYVCFLCICILFVFVLEASIT